MPLPTSVKTPICTRQRLQEQYENDLKYKVTLSIPNSSLISYLLDESEFKDIEDSNSSEYSLLRSFEDNDLSCSQVGGIIATFPPPGKNTISDVFPIRKIAFLPGVTTSRFVSFMTGCHKDYSKELIKSSDDHPRLIIFFSPGYDISNIRLRLTKISGIVDFKFDDRLYFKNNRIGIKYLHKPDINSNFSEIHEVFDILSELGQCLSVIRYEVISAFKRVYSSPVVPNTQKESSSDDFKTPSYLGIGVLFLRSSSIYCGRALCEVKDSSVSPRLIGKAKDGLDCYAIRDSSELLLLCIYTGNIKMIKEMLLHGVDCNISVRHFPLIHIVLITWIARYLDRGRTKQIVERLHDIIDLFLRYGYNPVMATDNNHQTIVEFLYGVAIDYNHDLDLLNLLLSIYNKITLSHKYRPSIPEIINQNHVRNPFIYQILNGDKIFRDRMENITAIRSITQSSINTGLIKSVAEKIFICNHAFINQTWCELNQQEFVSKSFKVKNLPPKLKDELFHHVFLQGFQFDQSLPLMQRYFKARKEFDEKLSDPNRIIDVFFFKDASGKYQVGGYSAWEVRHDPSKPNILMHYIVSTVVNPVISKQFNRFTSIFVFRTALALQYKFPNMNVISTYEALNPITILMSWLFFNSHRYAVAHIYYELLLDLISKFVGQAGMPIEYENGQYYKQKQSIRTIEIKPQYGSFKAQDFLFKNRANILVFFEASMTEFEAMMGTQASQQVLRDAILNCYNSLNDLLPDEILQLNNDNAIESRLKAKL